jgi:lysine 6-dehydrogenase
MILLTVDSKYAKHLFHLDTMKILLLGMGLMGPIIAKDCAMAKDVIKVTGCDVDNEKLIEAEKFVDNEKFDTNLVNVTDHEKLVEKMIGYDLVINGTASRFSMDVLEAAIESRRDIVDLAGGGYPQEGEIYEKVKKAGITAIPGCGVDPGLIDILSGQAINFLNEVHTLKFACGGLPRDPEPPLYYKIVFGGTSMPIRPGKVPMIVDGKEVLLDRYTQLEPVNIKGLKPMEAFLDGYPSSLLKLCIEKGVKNFRGKTIRYSGFVEKIMFLSDLGLISEKEVEFEGMNIVPRELFHKVIYPLVKFDPNEGDRDLTVLQVRVKGIKDKVDATIKYDMVDFYDEEKKLTSMAKTTGFTAAIIARILGRGKIKEKGIQWPVRVIHDDLFEELMQSLRGRGVEVNETIIYNRKI